MELSKADTLYLMMAVRNQMTRELKPSDKIMYERLFYKLSLSHNGQKIRELFGGVGNADSHTESGR